MAVRSLCPGDSMGQGTEALGSPLELTGTTAFRAPQRELMITGCSLGRARNGAARPAVEFREGLGAMRLWKGSLIVLLLTMLMAVAPVAAADDPATVLQRFTAARNSDVAGAIALLADTVRFVEGPICSPDSPCIGPAAVRPFLEQSLLLHVVLTAVGAPQVSGATVRQRFEVRGDPFAPAGIGRFVGDATVEVRDGKIVSYINVPDTSDAQTARYLASPPVQSPPPAQGTPSAPPRTGGGGEASFIRRLGDG